jgi:hypothetical protein
MILWRNRGRFPELRAKARVVGSSWDAARHGRAKDRWESQRWGKPSRLLVQAEVCQDRIEPMVLTARRVGEGYARTND